jgi:hypothetical protein
MRWNARPRTLAPCTEASPRTASMSGQRRRPPGTRQRAQHRCGSSGIYCWIAGPDPDAAHLKIPRVLRRRVGRPALETIVTTPEDTASAAEPTLDHGVTLNEIASHLGVHCHGESPGATSGRAALGNVSLQDPGTRRRRAYTALVGAGDLPPRGKLPFATVGRREGVRSTPRTASRARLVMSSTDL